MSLWALIDWPLVWLGRLRHLRAAPKPTLGPRCRAPYCWSEYGTPCGACPVERP